MKRPFSITAVLIWAAFSLGVMALGLVLLVRFHSPATRVIVPSSNTNGTITFTIRKIGGTEGAIGVSAQ
jgi:hypothetical protein